MKIGDLTTKLQGRLFPALFILVLALHASTIWSVEWLPFGDLGGHLELMDVMARYGDPHTAYAAYYRLPIANAPNVLPLYAARLFGPALGTMTVAKLLLTFYVVGLPLSLLSLCLAFGRSRWLALLACPLTFNAILNLGFLNFLVGMPLLFWMVALSRRYAERGGLWRAATLAGLGVLLFYSHVITWLIGLAISMAVLVLFFQRWWGFVRLVPPLLSLPLFVEWFWRKSVAQEATVTGRTMGSAAEGFGAVFNHPEVMLAEVHRYGMQFFRDAADEIAFVALACIWLLLMAAAGRRTTGGLHAQPEPESDSRPSLWARTRAGGAWLVAGLRAYALEVIVICCVVAYFVLPANIQEVDVINQRVVIFAMLFLVAVPHLAAAARPPVVPIAMAATLALAYPWVVRDEFEHFETALIGDLPEAIAALPDGSRLSYTMLRRDNDIVHMGPLWHLPKAMHALLNGGITNDSFAIRPSTPIQYREGAEIPPDGGAFWNRGRLRAYDYVLVRADSEPSVPSRAPLELIFQQNVWWLYRVQLDEERLADGTSVVAPGEMAGGEGGHVTRFECPDGTVLGGLDVAVNDGEMRVLAAIGPRCRPATDATTDAEPTTWLGGRGDRPIETLQCPSQQRVVGLFGRASALVDGVGLLCGPAATTDGSAVEPTRSEYLGGSGGLRFDTRCAAGVATGVTGRFASLVDGLGVLCGPATPASPGGDAPADPVESPPDRTPP